MKSALKSAVRGVGHCLLTPLEVHLLRNAPAPQWPHLFIVGAPRSGTSLFYELMVTRFQLCFFSNLSHRFYKTPAAASWLGRRIINNRSALYESDYGNIAGWSAPNEGGWIWLRWLEDGPWVDERAISDLPLSDMRSTLASISGLFDAPFINKNVMHSNRIRLLNAIFPGCLFLEVQRDPLATARSIIRAQKRMRGPKQQSDHWWSVRPSNAGGTDLVDRTIRQVSGVSFDIVNDCAFLGGERLHTISYEDLCADPEAELSRVRQFLEHHNFVLTDRNPVPRRFELHASKPLSLEDERRLQELKTEGAA